MREEEEKIGEERERESALGAREKRRGFRSPVAFDGVSMEGWKCVACL